MSRTTSRLLVLAAVLGAASVPAGSATASTADFAVAMSGPSQVAVGEGFLYRVTVSQDGKSRGTTRLSLALPITLTATGVSADGGSCTLTNQQITCDLTGITSGKPARVTVGVHPAVAGTATSTATLAEDADASDNTASVTTVVTAPAPEAQRISAPYQFEFEHGHGAADPASGELSVAVPAACLLDCNGTAQVGSFVILSGSGARRADVTVELDLRAAEISPLVTGATLLGTVHLIYADKIEACNTELVGARSGVASRRDERVTLSCSWPSSVQAGKPFRVMAGLRASRDAVGTQINAQAVAVGATITG
jgi:hypothetical protein